MPTSNGLASTLCSWAYSPIKSETEMRKKNTLEGSLSSMSLKKSPFTKATLFLEDRGAVEDVEVGICTAGHLPKTVLRVVANAGFAFQNAATPWCTMEVSGVPWRTMG